MADVTANAYVTLATANGKIFACSDVDAKVFVLSQSGEVLQTHSKPTGELMFNLRWVLKNLVFQSDELRPSLCAVDSEGAMLVVDCENEHLQVGDSSGQWSLLDLQPPVKMPIGAAVIDNKLYVCSYLEETLSVYASK